MAEIIKMPKMSDTMQKGTIASWLKQVGDKVKSGDILAEIETDKATMELESYEEGILHYKGAKEQESIEVGSILAIIGKENENIDHLITLKNQEKSSSDNTLELQTNKSEKDQNSNVSNNSEKQFPSSEELIKASPLAKKLAKQFNIKLIQIPYDPQHSRITKKDVEKFYNQQKRNNKSVKAQHHVSYEDVTISSIQKRVAENLTVSKQNLPHFYLQIKVQMDSFMMLREQLQKSFELKISVNDLIIKATALAIKKHPAVNVSFLDEEKPQIRYYHNIDIGVAIPLENGLVVPSIHSADKKSLQSLSLEMRELIQKANQKKLTPEDLQTSTFTTTNLGMFGITNFQAIINPPAACILAIGSIQKLPIIQNEEIKIGHVMELNLSCDHRALDGVVAAQFLQTLKQYLEVPISMII